MSENEENTPRPDKTISVVVTKAVEEKSEVQNEESADINAKAAKYDNLIDGMRDTFNQKHDTNLFDGLDENKMIELDHKLSEKTQLFEPSRKPSVGVVSLRPQSSPDDLMKMDLSDPKSIRRLYEEESNGNEKAREILNQLWLQGTRDKYGYFKGQKAFDDWGVPSQGMQKQLEADFYEAHGKSPSNRYIPVYKATKNADGSVGPTIVEYYPEESRKNEPQGI